jgi:hypothetical protein
VRAPTSLAHPMREQQQQHASPEPANPLTSAVHAETALAAKRLTKGSCGPPEEATIVAGCCAELQDPNAADDQLRWCAGGGCRGGQVAIEALPGLVVSSAAAWSGFSHTATLQPRFRVHAAGDRLPHWAWQVLRC